MRVSTLDQIGGAESQTRALADWCTKNQITNFEIFTDHGISGAKESRPALNRLMERVESGLCSQVVVYELIRPITISSIRSARKHSQTDLGRLRTFQR